MVNEHKEARAASSTALSINRSARKPIGAVPSKSFFSRLTSYLGLGASLLVLSPFAKAVNFSIGPPLPDDRGFYVTDSDGRVKPIEVVKSRTDGMSVIAQVNLVSPAGAPGRSIEPDSNRAGSDYHNFVAGSEQECQAACINDARCKAWTWVKPRTPRPQDHVAIKRGGATADRRCWLKNAVPRASADPCCISGVSTRTVTPNSPVQPGVHAPGTAGQKPALQMDEHTATRRVTPIRYKNPRSNQSLQAWAEGLHAQNKFAESSYRAALTETGVEVMIQEGLTRREIISINGHPPRNFVFRPGAAVAIYGRGFGEPLRGLSPAKAGAVRLVGNFGKAFPFSGGAVPIFTVQDWRSNVIYARLPGNMSGLEDLDNVRLEVVSQTGHVIDVPRVRFEAAREVTLLREIPLRYVKLPGQQAQYMTDGARPTGVLYTHTDTLEGVPAQSAVVMRDTSGNGAEWFAAGTDVYTLPLKPGFMIDSYEFWHGRTDQNPNRCRGNAGGQYFKGRYEVAIEADNVLKVNWGVWRCHRSPYLTVPAYDVNSSTYALNVYVVGPRGVNPFK